MKRVLVIGSGGSGKTYFSTRLAEKVGLPVHHLDQVFWGRDWTPIGRDEYRAEVDRISGEPSWVIDGNYFSSFDIRVPKADTIVFLDRSPLLCVFRVFKRRIRYSGQTRPSMAAGNKEKLTWEFIRYILSYRRTRRQKIMELLGSATHANTVVLRSNAEIDCFINDR